MLQFPLSTNDLWRQRDETSYVDVLSYRILRRNFLSDGTLYGYVVVITDASYFVVRQSLSYTDLIRSKMEYFFSLMRILMYCNNNKKEHLFTNPIVRSLEEASCRDFGAKLLFC